jgi:hypothetical protein
MLAIDTNVKPVPGHASSRLMELFGTFESIAILISFVELQI